MSCPCSPPLISALPGGRATETVRSPVAAEPVSATANVTIAPRPCCCEATAMLAASLTAAAGGALCVTAGAGETAAAR